VYCTGTLFLNHLLFLQIAVTFHGRRRNVIGAAKQKKHQEEEEIVKKLIKMGTLLKSLSGISSAAEMANALQVPEELPGDKKVDYCDCTDLSINARNYAADHSNWQTP